MRERPLRARTIVGQRTGWDPDGEGRALPEGGHEPDVATHETHEASRERQAQPGALLGSCVAGLHAGEVFEDASLVVGRDTDPRIPDGDLDRAVATGD